VVEDGGVSPRTRRRIQWAEDVIDNEGLGRKKSKGLLDIFQASQEAQSTFMLTGCLVCCIYHAPKEFGESSDESSSDSDDSDSDSGDDGSARPARRPAHNHEHDHNHRPGGHDHAKDKGKGKGRARSPNAYEKMPRSKKGGSK
jgi:protein phosphatase 1 regulatory subunit 11